MNLVILFFSILISFFCFWMSLKFISLYIKVKKWNRVTANIISKKIELHKKYSTAKSPYAVCVEYSYNFNNKDYTNTTVYLVELLKGQANHMEATAKKIINEMGDTMCIYVNPNKPKQSVLFCGGIGLYVFVLLMGFVSLLIALSNL